MLKRIKCLLKGHRYLMKYQPIYRKYHIATTDQCVCCKRIRGNYE